MLAPESQSNQLEDIFLAVIISSHQSCSELIVSYETVFSLAEMQLVNVI